MTNQQSPTVTRSTLLEGAWFAIEQCGRLLKDAATLYSVGSYSSAVALAMFAREELGRHFILIEMWEAYATRSPPSVKQVRDAYEDHQTKQEKGQLSFTYRGRTENQIGKLSQQQLEHLPQTPVFEKVRQLWETYKDRRVKAIPNERHHARMAALYVGIEDSGQGWHRPGKSEKEFAHGSLEDAMNDYSQRRGNLLTPELLSVLDPDLCAALQAWPNKPDLVHLPQLPTDCDAVYR